MNFKVGQRVKRIANPRLLNADNTTMPVGMTGVVVARADHTGHIPVLPDGFLGRPWGCEPETLAPLTDPKAEAFLESIRKMKPYSEPRAPSIADTEKFPSIAEVWSQP